jgi:hypothetical protein
MAKYLQGVGSTALKLTVGGVDLSTRLRSIEINEEVDQVEVTAANATAKEYSPGLRDDTWTIEMYQDFAASSVHDTISPLLGSTTGATFIFQTNGATVTATNPKFTVLGTVYGYQPVSGTVGDASMVSFEVKPLSGSATTESDT